MSESTSRWAIITGASSGIGRATARRLAEVGWNVGIHYRQSESAAQQVALEVERQGRKSILLKADLANPTAAGPLVEDAWRQTGGFEAWIHLAGADLLTGPEARWPFEQKLDLITRVDLIGTILSTREAGRRMSNADRGSIVTIGWDQSATGMEGDSGEIFAAIKGGVASFSRSLAKSLGPNVRVNCVAPGWIKTAWGENASSLWQERACREAILARWGTPDDIAQVVEFLISDRALFLTGQTINVNGGVVTS